ncbi:MAG TPA: endo-1,4-beta-xylanase [Gemmatimonadaceae bacterium]|nr:endo-1,4-beta-xylanase [Gemmatimonadaceae bacterium]
MTRRRTSRPLSRSLVALGALVLAACGGSSTAPPPRPDTTRAEPDTRSLRTLAEAKGISIGAAAGSGLFLRPVGDAQGDTLRAHLRREFNMVWSGNFMKFSTIRPSRAVFDYRNADLMVSFAAANGMKVRGHTLVWHQQNPGWLTSGSWTREQALAAMYEHIDSVVTHFKGKLAAWDVVNEAINDDGTMRSTLWSQRIGDDYIALAFQRAAQVEPGVPLYYNDYNIEGPGAKADAAYDLVRSLKNAGVPIHGIGFQGHFIAGQVPTRAQLAANFARFAALGLAVQITELDIRVPMPSTAASLQQQAFDFATVFQACLDVPACNAVEIAGVFDGESWVPGTFPGWGDAHLLSLTFGRKPAYWSVHKALGGRGG